MKERKYTGQFSVVATESQAAIFEGLAAALVDDKAPVARMAIDQYFGLVDGNLVGGETVPEAVERIAQKFLKDRANVYALDA